MYRPVALMLLMVMLAALLLACAPATPTPTAAPTVAPSAALTVAPSAEAPTVVPSAPPATATVAPASPTPLPLTTVPATPAPPTRVPLPSVPPTPASTAHPAPVPTIAVTLPIAEWKVSTLLVGPGSPGQLYALQQGDLLTATGTYDYKARLWFSDDLGANWKAFPGVLPSTNPSCLNGLSMDYAAVDALYASTCTGIYRWNGSQWARISEQKTGALAITYGKPNIMWATGFAPGPYILRSEDGGVTWQRADTGLDTFTGQANIGIDPRDGKTIYSMINPKYAGSYLRRGDASGRWVTMPVPAQGYTYIGMTIDGATGAMYVATLMADRHWQLWRSPNPSEPDLVQVRWEMVHDFGEESVDHWVYVLASGGTPQGLALFARLDVGNCSPLQGIPCTSTLLRSLDGGQTWGAVPVPEN